VTAKKMPRSKTRRKPHTPKFTPPHHVFASAERFERTVGKFGGTLSDLPRHLERIRAAGGSQ
jgi:hypothetical protein